MMTRRDLILHGTEIRKINGHCTCGVAASGREEREASLEYATPAASESSLIWMVVEPQVCVWHNSYLARV